jgi:AcrR family transcriptional regulator
VRTALETREARQERRQRHLTLQTGQRRANARGIGDTSIEAIAAAAGFTRGAVYSNFGNKDERIIAMLEDHVERSVRHHLELLERHRDPLDFVAALRDSDRNRQDPLGRSPLLHMELILYVARSEKRRPELAKRLRARRELVTEIITATSRAGGRGAIVDPAWAGAMLLALEDAHRSRHDPGRELRAFSERAAAFGRPGQVVASTKVATLARLSSLWLHGPSPPAGVVLAGVQKFLQFVDCDVSTVSQGDRGCHVAR